MPVPNGEAMLGRHAADGGFGWDNEYDAHVVSVPAFAIDRYPVTNARYLEFVRAGGYSDRSLWDEHGWEWRMKHAVEHPIFWMSVDGHYRLRGMFRMRAFAPAEPVYVSHAEASAFARWARCTLPTEAEWHRAAYGEPGGGVRAYPWGSNPPDRTRANVDFGRHEPIAVSSHPLGASAFGIEDLVGNGWEWTSSLFRPFPGFRAQPFYPTYSADFFDGRHRVVKGGSQRTALRLLRRSFRNWFQQYYPYVYAKFRCVTR
jgi:ergothioneine biosynthesis protein EgtB